ncbi:Serine/threonine-protein kinase haspin [Glugoides intestinalis]
MSCGKKKLHLSTSQNDISKLLKDENITNDFPEFMFNSWVAPSSTQGQHLFKADENKERDLNKCSFLHVPTGENAIKTMKFTEISVESYLKKELVLHNENPPSNKRNRLLDVNSENKIHTTISIKNCGCIYQFCACIGIIPETSKEIKIAYNHNHMSQRNYNGASTNRHDGFINTEVSSFVEKHIRKRLQLEAKLACQTRTIIEDENIVSIPKKKIYSIAEIQKVLSLRTIPFSQMPEAPIKIGEASFSEVFRIGTTVYKVIPLTEWYSIDSFYKEAFIMDILKNEKGVCKLHDKFLVEGRYTEGYMQAWDNFKGSENTRPSEFSESQVFGVLTMNDCGADLEKYQFQSFQEVMSIIAQFLDTITTLEDKYNFEHRDMHWGNIMIKDSVLSIIDLNFARLEKDKVVFTDLNLHTWLFEGDVNIDIQFSVYLKMKELCKSDWKSFNPVSNMLWFRYLLRKLCLKAKCLPTEKDFPLKIMNLLIRKAEQFTHCAGFKRWFDSDDFKITFAPKSYF